MLPKDAPLFPNSFICYIVLSCLKKY
jgi:hypothetical protein